MNDMFLDGSSATFIGAIMTLAVLCFFSSKKQGENSDNSNFIQNIVVILCNRTIAFLTREGDFCVNTSKDSNYQMLSKAIAESLEVHNPYKKEMFQLVNDIQITTAKYQNHYFSLVKEVQKLNEKLLKAPENLSSCFYSFLFCVFVFSVECLFYPFTWMIDVVCWVSIISLVYWFFVWIHYWNVIQHRNIEEKAIVYEFKFKTCFGVFVPALLFSFAWYLVTDKDIILRLIYFFSVLFIGAFAILKIKTRKDSIFTHYFNLIHFLIIISYSLAFCFIESVCFNKTACFSAENAECLSVIFALFSCLIFPLCIPLLRLRVKVVDAIRDFKEATQEYEKQTKEKNENLNTLFNSLHRFRLLNPIEL